MRKPILKPILLLFFVFNLASFCKAQSCIMDCKDTVIIGLDQKCEALVSSDQIYLNPLNCPDKGEVHILDYFGFDLGNKVDHAFLDSILTVKVVGASGTAASCASKVWFKDIMGPEIICNDTFISCWLYDKFTVLPVKNPVILDNCAGVDTFGNFDQYFQLGCNAPGFNGYFELSNWKQELSCTGDGKISSFLPDTVILYGANKSIDTLNPKCKTTISIKIPSDGKVYFDWNINGTGNPDYEVLTVIENGNTKVLSSSNLLSGHYQSNQLIKGSYFSIDLYSDGDSNNMSALLAGFKFISKATGVLVRTWKAVDNKGNTSFKNQNILIEAFDLKSVIFPGDFNSTTTIIKCGNPYDINITGWPYFINTSIPNYYVIVPIVNNLCISVSFKDSTVQICEGSFSVFRIWTIVEKCTGVSISHIQEIKVIDNESPIISKPKDLSLATDANKCTASVTIEPLIVTDLCSPSNIKVDIFTPFNGTGYGPYKDIPVGNYQIYYTATDNCGNSSTAVSSINIKDNTPPKAIAKANEVFFLDKYGQCKIKAKNLDNGSLDNCCVESFKVKKANQPVSSFSEELVLGCNDVSSGLVNLSFRVYDCHGNYNDINTFISLKDNIPPTIKCPSDIALSCTQDLTNLDKYGTINYTDNCTDLIQYSDIKDIGKCGNGTIKRNWIIKDLSNNTAACSQTITVLYDQAWNIAGNMIAWPLDYNGNGCKNIDDLIPALLPVPNRQPVLTGLNSCTSLFIDFNDVVISGSSSGCITVERHWQIIDYCQYEPSQGQKGKWIHTQLIKITDNEAPVLITPVDITVQAQNNDCTAFVNMSKAFATDCDPNISFTNSNNTNGADISGKYDVGVNLVSITATDHCGNSTTKTIKITVRDMDKPTALCHASVNIDLAGVNQSGEKTIDPQLINNGSSDNCSSQNQLLLTVFPEKISCGDLGTKAVLLTVTDQSGNLSNCNSFINVTDNSGLCGTTSYKISGHIKNSLIKAIEDVDCALTGDKFDMFQTGNDGSYEFDLLAKNGDFTITPHKNIFPLNGVSTYDLILLNDHILGKKFLDSPYKYVAADVNNNKHVSTSDYIAIRDLILLNTDKFAKVESWRFIPIQYVFTSYQPTIPNFPEELQYIGLQQDIVNADFIGVKMGDVNNSSNPALYTNPEIRSSDIMDLMVPEKIVLKDEYFRVPISINMNAIEGFQFCLNINNTLFKNGHVVLAENSRLKEENIGRHIDKSGILLVSWVNNEDDCCVSDSLFYFEGIATKDFNLRDLFNLEESLFKPEVYNQNREVGSIKLHWLSNDKLSDMLIAPNPFDNRIDIELSGDIAQETEISLLNFKGEVLISRDLSSLPGKLFSLESLDTLPVGIYFLKVKSGNSLSIRKLVKQTP